VDLSLNKRFRSQQANATKLMKKEIRKTEQSFVLFYNTKPTILQNLLFLIKKQPILSLKTACFFITNSKD